MRYERKGPHRKAPAFTFEHVLAGGLAPRRLVEALATYRGKTVEELLALPS
jgi:hypothetical protein